MNGIVRGIGMAAASWLIAQFVFAADVDPESYRPKWQVGQKWIVETVSRQTAEGRDPPANAQAVRVRWQFEVQAVEKVEERECYKVQVTCLAGDDRSGITMLWVDRQAMTLRQFQTTLPTPDGPRTLTEMYRTSTGQAFPAFVPLTVPPVELPVFQAGIKGTNTFSYEATTNPPGVKAADDVSFSYSVQQRFDQPDEERVKELLPDTYAKSPEKKSTLEVRLETGQSKTRQFWQRDMPWPVYSDNGIAQARLIEVVAPQAKP